jgi:hypothetical protein
MGRIALVVIESFSHGVPVIAYDAEEDIFCGKY